MPDLRRDVESYARAAAARLGEHVHASVTLRRHGTLEHVASSNERAARCDQVEVDSDEGPCVDAMHRLAGVLVPDLAVETRWPTWRTAALDAGFASAAALPGVVDDTTTVALNLYADERDPWDTTAIVAMDGYVQEVAEALRTRLGS